MRESMTYWVDEGERHELNKTGRFSLCKKRVVGGDLYDLRGFEELAAGGVSLCQLCESRAEARQAESIVLRPTYESLSPELKQLRERLDREAERRIALQKDVERPKGTGSKSVRTVSGGLPTLGR